MVAATVAVCVSVPEVPLKVSVALPAAAEDAALMVTLCPAPGVSLSDDGWAVTPAGSPVTATVTVPEKVLRDAALTLIF